MRGRLFSTLSFHRSAISRAALLFGLALVLAGCTPKPTPYQPVDKKGGYEETRLKENVYRVSFRGNRYTPETRMLDYIYLRCAELTREAGYSHFLVLQDYGKTQGRAAPRSHVSVGFGFSSGIRRSAWGVGAGLPLSPGYGTVVDYHLGEFVIRMINAEDAAKETDALEADFLLKSINEKIGVPAP
jgi:hypothetical protein